MPCNMMGGSSSGDFAWNDVRRLEKRVAELEQAMCGVAQMLMDLAPPELHPEIAQWWEKHQKQIGHCR